MLIREVRIDSYFSLPTDLAAEMGSWPEFVSGTEYTTTLRSEGELVETSLQEDEGSHFVRVRGSGHGNLFFKVLGITLYALAGHSDDVWPRVMRWDSELAASNGGT
jgi:hypothetical protein